MSRPARCVVSLVPVAGGANLWTATLDNGVRIEVSGVLIDTAARERRPVAVSPRTLTSELTPVVAKVAPTPRAPALPDGEEPAFEGATYSSVELAEYRALRTSDVGQVHRCSACKQPGHKARTCPTLGKAPSPSSVKRNRSLARAKARAAAEALAGVAPVRKSGDGA